MKVSNFMSLTPRFVPAGEGFLYIMIVLVDVLAPFKSCRGRGWFWMKLVAAQLYNAVVS